MDGNGCKLGHHPQRASAEAPETSAEDRDQPYREDTIEDLGRNPGAHRKGGDPERPSGAKNRTVYAFR